ncbi:Hypothetical predicted protein, partial [Olea europaea subsp. europaea]
VRPPCKVVSSLRARWPFTEPRYRVRRPMVLPPKTWPPCMEGYDPPCMEATSLRARR